VERRLLFDVVSNIVTKQLDLDSLYRKDTPS
jgi:hypothetical protein